MEKKMLKTSLILFFLIEFGVCQASSRLTELLNESDFQKLGWQKKISILQIYCKSELYSSQVSCKKAVSIGLIDKAMVVRDHALKLAIENDKKIFTVSELNNIAQKIVADQKNHSNFKPLWIVDRAHRFLTSQTNF
jgi:hypothetical protein